TTEAVFVLDVPNGEYDVIVTLGETIVAHDQMGVFLEGVQVDSVTTAAGEFANNSYRTSVSDGQLTLRLQDLGGSDSWVMINALDVVFAGPDQTGPFVNNTSASGTLAGPIDRLQVNFNELIQEASFTIDDVIALEGPSGPITPTGVNPLPTGDYEITFASQNESGPYRLVIGPDVLDIAGNPMDQDGDGIAGEIPDDQFETNFTLEAGLAVVAAYDFGSSTSPLASGFTRVTGGDAYNASTGFGWQDDAVFTINWGGEPLTQDLNYTRDATFVVDIPNGEYDIELTMGEAIISHEQMGVFIEGVQVDSVSTAGFEFVTNTYRTSISDGQLSLRLQDLGGSNVYAVINGLRLLYAGPDTTGPMVDSTDASGTVEGPIDRVRVAFNEPIQADSFTLADISRLSGPDGDITPIAVNEVAVGEFEIVFPTTNEPGEYRLTLGPDVLDIAGNSMDQDQDGTFGEADEDQFDTTFVLQAGLPTIARFDFGTNTSPVETDYTRVSSSDQYDSEVGFGWTDGSVYSISWGGATLTRDLNYTADATFAMDLPNGQYDLVMTMGEAIISHDQMGIFVEGVQVDTVSTAGFQFVTNAYRANVHDGQLSLRIADQGGSNAWAVINALEILYVGSNDN
ncbi:MAG: Ig-like domain-containing protein, partial [Planctomycetota bacterium]